VSCGGNILINVGPTKEGTISPIFQERLLDLGKWLRINGEAIYESRPWVHQNESSGADVWYTSRGGNVYAIVLEWPEDDILILADPVSKEDTKVSLLGLEESLEFRQIDEGLAVHFPSMSKLVRECGSGCRWGYVLKLENLANNGENAEEEAPREELEEVEKVQVRNDDVQNQKDGDVDIQNM